MYVNKRPEKIQRWKSVDDHRYHVAYELDFPITVLHETEAKTTPDDTSAGETNE